MLPSHRFSLIVPAALLVFGFTGCTHAETRTQIPAPQVDASLPRLTASKRQSSPADVSGEHSRCLSA